MLLANNAFISEEDFHAVSKTSPERVISKTGPCICDLQDVLSCISLMKEKQLLLSEWGNVHSGLVV